MRPVVARGPRERWRDYLPPLDALDPERRDLGAEDGPVEGRVEVPAAFAQPSWLPRANGLQLRMRTRPAGTKRKQSTVHRTWRRTQATASDLGETWPRQASPSGQPFGGGKVNSR